MFLSPKNSKAVEKEDGSLLKEHSSPQFQKVEIDFQIEDSNMNLAENSSGVFKNRAENPRKASRISKFSEIAE